MKRKRIVKAEKVATSNRVRSMILRQADTKPQRIMQLGFISHTSRIAV